MKKTQYFVNYFKTIYQNLESIDSAQLEQASSMSWETHQSSKKIIIAGNGGSAAMASHVAVDFTKAAGIRAVNFNEADLITCFANDYGFENWVAKAIEFYGDPGDVLLVISSSGKSKNMINATASARAKKFSKIVTFSGFEENNPLSQSGDINLWVNSKAYNYVENLHQIWLLALVDLVIGDKEYSA